MRERQERIRILIADDDYVSCRQIRELVTHLGHLVVGEAIDGGEAIEMTASLQPDIVLMDMKMSPVDGLEATRQIQRQCPTPVVMLTGYQTRELVEEATSAGAVAYLAKPSDAGELERTLTIAKARFDDMLELRRLNARLSEEIGRRIQIEEELKKIHNELEMRVRQRTTELAEANDGLRLRIAEGQCIEEQLNTLIEEKTHLLREIHHRTRNNMQFIHALIHL